MEVAKARSTPLRSHLKLSKSSSQEIKEDKAKIAKVAYVRPYLVA